MKIVDVVGYILNNYPYKNKLTKAKINKIIYLVDWKSSIDNKKQITSINWLFNNYGPDNNDIDISLDLDERITIEIKKNYYGNESYIVKLVKNENFKEPDEENKKVLDFVINVTKDLKWTDFINTVFSTYPITHSEKGSVLNLVELAKKYKK